jgi:hypothetical protein
MPGRLLDDAWASQTTHTAEVAMSSPDKANQAFARNRLTLEWLRTESSDTGSAPFLRPPEVDARTTRYAPRAPTGGAEDAE